MEMYLFRPDQYDMMYNCSDINVDDVPFKNRQFVTESIITIALCAIYYILYIPCTISIYNRMNNPCYRLLFYMSIVDCCILWILGFLHGYLSLTGAVFCSHPTFIFLIGCLLSGVWIAESVCEVTLVLNRCIALVAPMLEKMMFGGWRLSIWIFASLGYGTWWAYNICPVLFNGIHFTWFFNPYVGYRDDPTGIYNNKLHIIWDMSVAVGVPCLYVFFAFVFFVKTKAIGSGKGVSHKQKMMLLQVFIISVLNFVACSVYVHMMYVMPSEPLMHFAQFCWLHIHGFPPVIYLCLNSTIRKDTITMVHSVASKLNANKIKDIFSITATNSRASESLP